VHCVNEIEMSYRTEHSRQVWASTEARAVGHGGIAVVAPATGIAESPIRRGLRDLDAREALAAVRGPRLGGGLKRATETAPPCCATLDAWGSRRHRPIPSRHCAGRARVRGR
jgi:hypothetical protein